jgi:hypothetical protein
VAFNGVTSQVVRKRMQNFGVILQKWGFGIITYPKSLKDRYM